MVRASGEGRPAELAGYDSSGRTINLPGSDASSRLGGFLWRGSPARLGCQESLHEYLLMLDISDQVARVP